MWKDYRNFDEFYYFWNYWIPFIFIKNKSRKYKKINNKENIKDACREKMAAKILKRAFINFKVTKEE